MSAMEEQATRKVYVLTAGEYSDYHLVGVFSSVETATAYIQETAKRYTLALSGEFYTSQTDPREFNELTCVTVDPEPPEVVDFVTVAMRYDGRVASAIQQHAFASDRYRIGFSNYYMAKPRIMAEDYENGYRLTYSPDSYQLVWRVGCTDIERAVKVVNEKRAQIIAAGVCGNGPKTAALF